MPSLDERQLDIGFAGRTVFGAGTVERVGEVIHSLGIRRAFVVTDPGVAHAGPLEAVRNSLRSAGLAAGEYTSVTPNPTTADIADGSSALLEFGTQDTVVVAVGGGSSMDAAKGVSLHAMNPGSVLDLDYRKTPAHPGLPVVAVPTTSGTGSETNGFGVILDPESERKFYAGHASVQPRAAILDPLLTLGLPPAATAATGIDVLTHALEALMSRNSNPYADGLALQAIRMVSDYLTSAVRGGADIEARSHMLLAAHLAGLAFSSGTGLGLCHALAHSVSARLHVAHGVALAAFLPEVMSFNLPASTKQLALAALSMGVSESGRDDQANAAAAIRATAALVSDLVGERPLEALDVGEDLLSVLVRDTVEDGVMFNTPRTPSPEEVRQLLEAAL